MEIQRILLEMHPKQTTHFWMFFSSLINKTAKNRCNGHTWTSLIDILSDPKQLHVNKSYSWVCFLSSRTHLPWFKTPKQSCSTLRFLDEIHPQRTIHLGLNVYKFSCIYRNPGKCREILQFQLFSAKASSRKPDILLLFLIIAGKPVGLLADSFLLVCIINCCFVCQ